MAVERRARRSRTLDGLAIGAVIAMMGLIGFLGVIVVRDDAEPQTGTRAAIRPTPAVEPSRPAAPVQPAETPHEADQLLDLETGEAKPLPASIREEGWNGYAISPDGSEVAYYGFEEGATCKVPELCTRSRHVGLFVATLDGSNVRQVANGGIRLGVPGWSPDGTKIAYVGRSGHDITRRSNIFVVDLTTGVKSQVTFGSVDVSDAQFSPDGSSIVYTAYRPGGSQVRLAPVAGGEGSKLVGGRGSSAHGASLSPDGSLLSYICVGTEHGVSEVVPTWALKVATWDVCLANGDGSNPRRFVEADDTVGIRSASWSPDGSRLAFWDYGRQLLRVVDVETGRTVRAVAWPEAGSPTWADDHTLIVDAD